ncbi:MAG: hypothetical protein OEV80_14655, partial [candidate division Zixibacteria bacterium]|nr:hypothetical protein [candidate division Zixibacteria bacterium]
KAKKQRSNISALQAKSSKITSLHHNKLRLALSQVVAAQRFDNCHKSRANFTFLRLFRAATWQADSHYGRFGLGHLKNTHKWVFYPSR